MHPILKVTPAVWINGLTVGPTRPATWTHPIGMFEAKYGLAERAIHILAAIAGQSLEHVQAILGAAGLANVNKDSYSMLRSYDAPRLAKRPDLIPS